MNHLSWCRRAWLDGEDLLPRALADDGYLRQAQRLFDPALVRMLGMHLNEYLYYYYYAEQALAAITGEGMTRGEEIVELNTRLIEQLEEIGVERDPERALRAFFGYEKRRGATYMHYAYGGMSIEEANRQQLFDADIPPAAGEGYAGVALALIEALETGRPHYTALNVPNQGAIDGMADEDVVEVELPGGWKRRTPPPDWRGARAAAGADAGGQAIRAVDRAGDPRAFAPTWRWRR